MKFYAVKNGRKKGVYKTLPECMEQIKDYTNALLNFNTLVYCELTFKTKENFNAIINTFIKDDALDIRKVL